MMRGGAHAQKVVEDVGTGGPELAPVLTPAEHARAREIGRLRSPEPRDVGFLLDLLTAVELRTPERARQNYERGRVDERLYWRARGRRAGEPLKLAPHTPLVFVRSSRRGWEVTAPVSWVVTVLATAALVVGVVVAFVP